MRTELKSNLSYNKTFLILSALCILSGVLAIVFGELIVPIVTGLFAAIFVFETGRRRIFSFAVPATLVAISVVSFFSFGSMLILWVALCILLAILLFYSYTKLKSKFDFSLILTGVVVVFTVISFIAIGMICAESFNLEASIAFYQELYSTVREEASKVIVDIYSELYNDASTVITLTEAGEMIDSAIGTLIAIVGVVSFVITGLCFKVFTTVISKCVDNKEELRQWRFQPPSFYGHFYYILILAYFLASFNDCIISVVIANLYIIFMWMFAYVGFNAVLERFAGKRSPITIFFVVAFAVILLSSFVLQILAMFGAIYVTKQNTQDSSNA